MDLLEPGDFVSQTNDVQCIGASLQIMVNISAPRSDRTAATQRSLFLLARKLSWLPGDSRRPSPDWQPRGASSRGWARALRQLGIGNYVLRSEPTLDGALALAARTMRLTGLPVGLLVWRGRHAWVMTGFRDTADPTLGTGFRIGGRLDLDAVINQDYAYTGGWAASGNEETPFSRLSATYRW